MRTSTRMLPSGVPLGVCIQIMIHVSDNYCHSDIVHWIGIAHDQQHDPRRRDSPEPSTARSPPESSVLYAGNRTTTNDLTSMMSAARRAAPCSRRGWSDDLINADAQPDLAVEDRVGHPARAWRRRASPARCGSLSGLLQADTAIVNGTQLSVRHVDHRRRRSAAGRVAGDLADGVRALQRLVRHGGVVPGAADDHADRFDERRGVARAARSSHGRRSGHPDPGARRASATGTRCKWGTRKLWIHYTGAAQPMTDGSVAP